MLYTLWNRRRRNDMEVLFCVAIVAIKLIYDSIQEKKANRYADMVVRRYKEE